MRPHSTAYPSVSPSSTLWSGMSLFVRKHSRAAGATSLFVCLVLFMSLNSSHDVITEKPYLRQKVKKYFGGAQKPGYFSVEDSVIDSNSFHFAAVTDLDELSRVTTSKKLEFYSKLLPGVLIRNPTSGMYTVSFEPPRTLVSRHNEAGRGMELSELTIFDNRLLSFDDRTGTVFELLNKDNGRETFVVPRMVITEGDGDTDKGMKWEWATVKGKELYLGSMGKEYTNPDGSVANTNNLWVSVLNSKGELFRKDWTREFNFVREALGAKSPGYTINEAIMWSQKLKKWVFLPRRISSEMYDENTDERKGSNKLAIVDEFFTKAKVVEIKMSHVDPLHGFSTFAFVPGTNDEHALAIRSVEENCVGGDENACIQRTFFIVFNVLTGDVLMDEFELPDTVKYEGVEFVNINTPEV
mmetsp:Transcript_43669/g.64061  ORF Transcript_43669/g.64061 Transcript_43669/m.64061 type:complete len:412 (+) Transcript_43669:357-1592(+)